MLKIVAVHLGFLFFTLFLLLLDGGIAGITYAERLMLVGQIMGLVVHIICKASGVDQ